MIESKMVLIAYISGALGILAGLHVSSIMTKSIVSHIMSMVIWPILLAATIADLLTELGRELYKIYRGERNEW
jgi:hypothetical protein